MSPFDKRHGKDDIESLASAVCSDNPCVKLSEESLESFEFIYFNSVINNFVQLTQGQKDILPEHFNDAINDLETAAPRIIVDLLGLLSLLSLIYTRETLQKRLNGIMKHCDVMERITGGMINSLTVVSLDNAAEQIGESPDQVKDIIRKMLFSDDVDDGKLSKNEQALRDAMKAYAEGVKH